MSNELGGITNRSIRDSVGSRCFTSCALAIDDANVENVQTTVAVVHCVNGVFQTDLATIAEMDLSALAVLSAKDGSVLSAAGATSATKAHPALAAGDDTQTIVYILACKGNVVYIIEETVDVAAAQDDAQHRLTCPSGYAPFAAIKIVQIPTVSVGVAAFQLGVDDLTSITGRTTSFYNLSVCPQTVADMATV
jgi:hypothetical protein